MTKNPIKILVLFYSLTGATAKLAEVIADGVKGVADTEVEIKQVRELLPPKFFADKPQLKKTHDKLASKFEIATAEDLINADGVAFGTPTHFGSFASQFKQFLDQLSGEWLQ